jgi:hypothetical protein
MSKLHVPRHSDCGLHDHLGVDFVAVLHDALQILQLVTVNILDLCVPFSQIVVNVLKPILQGIVLFCEPLSHVFNWVGLDHRFFALFL